MFETHTPFRAIGFEFWILFIRICLGFRYSYFGIALNEIDLLAFLQRYDRFLPMRFATKVGSALAFLFAGVIAGVHVHHLLLKKLLDCLLDLNLVSSRPDTKDVLVLLLA